MVKLKSVITCPYCGHKSKATMPTNACIHSYECPHCHKTITSKSENCCVFCSYGSEKRPVKQQDKLTFRRYDIEVQLSFDS